MQYRRLGRTNLQVSILGLGGGYVCLLEDEPATAMYRRASELGINYFDGRYGRSSFMMRPVIAEDRARYVVGSKTHEIEYDQVLARVDGDLEELGTDYLDVYYLRCYSKDDLERQLRPDGGLAALKEARSQGKIRFIGLSGHSDLDALADGVDTDAIDVVMFPYNVVRRDAEDRLIPSCQAHDTGMLIMKPVNVGMVPAEVCLPWLANQPIHTMVVGASNIEQLELDVRAVDRDPMALTIDEQALVERWREDKDRETCRICDHICRSVCEKSLPLDVLIYHDMLYNEYRALGMEGMMEAPLALWVKRSAESHFRRRLAAVESCTRCGKCEDACPHHLNIMALLDQMLVDHPPIIAALHDAGWQAKYAKAELPFWVPAPEDSKKDIRQNV